MTHILIQDVESCKDYQEAIKLTGQALESAGYTDEKYLDYCLNRESQFPTGLLLKQDKGVAIPHGDSELVKESAISMLRLNQAVPFKRMDDSQASVEAKLVFHLALADGNSHLGLLKSLMRAFQVDEFYEKILTCDQETAKKYLKDKIKGE